MSSIHRASAWLGPTSLRPRGSPKDSSTPSPGWPPVTYPRKSFPIRDVLSLVTGYDVSLRGEAGYHVLEDYVAGRRLTPSDRVTNGLRITQHGA